MFYSFRNSTKIAVYKQVVRKKGTAINNYCTYSTPLFFWDYLNSLNKVLVIICNLMTISIDIFIILSIKLNMIDSLTGRASFPNHPRAFLCKSKSKLSVFWFRKYHSQLLSFTILNWHLLKVFSLPDMNHLSWPVILESSRVILML
jgi:hypothetical protein